MTGSAQRCRCGRSEGAREPVLRAERDDLCRRSGRGHGVYFHSLDTDRLAPAIVARMTYRLPYCCAEVGVTLKEHQIASAAWRRWPGPRGAISRVTLEVAGGSRRLGLGQV